VSAALFDEGFALSPVTSPAKERGFALVAHKLARETKPAEETAHLPFVERGVLTVGGGQATLDGAPVTVREVVLESTEIAWGQGGFGPSFDVHNARVLLRLEDKSELCVGERLARSAEEAEAELNELAELLRGRLLGAAAGDKPAAPPALPRFSFAREGDVVVLRDYENLGPRSRTTRFWVMAALLLLGAGGAVMLTLQARGAEAPLTTVLGYVVLAAVLFVGSFAMSQIAAHAAKYKATHTPLAWFGDDRVVVQPWLSRAGHVDRRPEGRLGAAVVTAELDEVVVIEREGLQAVTLTGPHGAIEVALTPQRAEAEQLARTVSMLLERVTSPKKRAPSAARRKMSTAQAAP
jgi:hypothetical protein